MPAAARTAALQPQPQHASPERSTRDHERPQRELGVTINRNELFAWIDRELRRRRGFFTATELDVLRAIVNVCDWSNGRCDAKLNYLAKLANRDRRCVSRAIARLVELGVLDHVWFTVRMARKEFPVGTREWRKGRATNWLRVGTVAALTELVAERKRAKRKALNSVHSRAKVRVDNRPPTFVHSHSGSPDLKSSTSPTPTLAFPSLASARARGDSSDALAARHAPSGRMGDVHAANTQTALPHVPAAVEGGRARVVPLRELAPELRASLAEVERTWSRLGFPALDANLRRALENRVLEGVPVSELEAAAYGASLDGWVRRRAKCPGAVVFASRPQVEKFAHAGRALRDLEVGARLELEARRAADAIAPVLSVEEFLRDVADVPIVHIAPVVQDRDANLDAELEATRLELEDKWARAEPGSDRERDFAEQYQRTFGRSIGTRGAS